MIGRADIERSKSNFFSDAWVPQACYSHGSFWNTFRRCTRWRAPPRRDPTTLSLEAARTSGRGFRSFSTKGSLAVLSQLLFALKISIGRTFALMFFTRFPFAMRQTWYDCVILWQMYCPSETCVADCPLRRRRAASSDHLGEETGREVQSSSGVALRLTSPTYFLPMSLFHSLAWLESNSTGSSFPADSPVLLAVGSLDSSQEQWESRSSIHARHLSDDETFGYLQVSVQLPMTSRWWYSGGDTPNRDITFGL